MYGNMSHGNKNKLKSHHKGMAKQVFDVQFLFQPFVYLGIGLDDLHFLEIQKSFELNKVIVLLDYAVEMAVLWIGLVSRIGLEMYFWDIHN